MATYDASPISPTISSGTHDARGAEVAFTGTVSPSPPSFGTFSPVAGAVTRTAAVGFTVTDVDGLASILVWAEYADGTIALIYDGSGFSTAFDAASTVSGTTTKTFSIQADAPGYPGNYTLYVLATDSLGASASTSSAYTLTNPPAAPSFGSFSPAAGAVARADNVDFTVTDAEGFSKILVWAVLADGSTVMVYDGAAFGGQVNAASSVAGTTTKSFSITYDGDGWEDDYTLHVLAIDATGVSATTSSAYTLTDPPTPPDATAPTTTLVSPAEGDITRTTPIVVDVTDASAFAAIFAWIVYPDGTTDVVHDGEAFSVPFAGGSTRTSISGGYRYTLRRAGGWTAAPTVRFRPVDAAGNTP